MKLPDLSTLRCFHVNGDTGITYNKNVWHHPLLVKKKQDFWVIDRINDQEDSSINLKEYHFTNNETRFITSINPVIFLMQPYVFLKIN